MTADKQEKLAVSAVTIGFVTAIICAIIYFMKLSIFSRTDVEWFFVVGLVSAGLATIFGILRSVWTHSNTGNY